MGISTRSTTIRIYMLSPDWQRWRGLSSRFIPRPDMRGGRRCGTGRHRVGGDWRYVVSGGVGTVLGTLFGVAIQGLFRHISTLTVR